MLIKLQEDTAMTTVCKSRSVIVPKGTVVEYERHDVENKSNHTLSYYDGNSMLFAIKTGSHCSSDYSDSQLNSAMTFIADSFVLAIGYGSNRPSIEVKFLDQHFAFYMSYRSIIHVATDNQLIGIIRKDRFDFYAAHISTATEVDFFNRFIKAPNVFLAECSRDSNSCCYCRDRLKDFRSVALGYGPTCAKRWGLPWGLECDVKSQPTFAKAYTPEVHGLIMNICQEQYNKTNWDILNDWLSDNGLPRCFIPNYSKRLRLPRFI